MEVEEERGRIARKRAANRLTFVNRIPEEVLGDILALASYLTEPIRVMDPVIVSPNVWKHPALATCHRWRHCALHTPALWSEIHVNDRASVAELATWVSRAGILSLHVSFMYTEPPTQHFLKSLQVLGSYTNRIRKLQLLCQHKAGIYNLVPFIGDFSGLKELEVWWNADAEYVMRLFSSANPSTLPNLELLRLHNSEIAPNALSLDGINPHRLKELRIGEEVTPRALFDFLRQCGDLRKLDWDLHWVPAATFRVSDERLVIPKLESLQLRGTVVPLVLSHFGMPELCRLHLSSYQDHYPLFPSLTLHLNITHLQLTAFHHLTVDELRNIFTSFLNLECLLFEWRESTIPAIKALADWSTNPSWEEPTWNCPRMRELYLPLASPTYQHQLRSETAYECMLHVRQYRGQGAGKGEPLLLVVDEFPKLLGNVTDTHEALGLRLLPAKEFPRVF